ncbi:MAG: c-type cytochrome [Cyclobacteriaceae bacterium]
MKKILKIIAYMVSFLVILIIGGYLYISMALPNVGPAPEALKVISTPDKIARGKYLANHVMVCVDCHSKRDFSLFSAPPIKGSEAAGGERFDHSMGFPGVFISPNITPAGIGEYTDGELFRVITTGVKNTGDPIFPIMPYENYGQLDPEDIEAVIAYIRSLDPISSENDTSEPDFPFNLVMRTMPKEANFTTRPDPSDQIAYGYYLVTAAACRDCHTKFESGEYVGEWLAGGREFGFPDGSILTSPNLTPHATGLGNWNENMFIERFKLYENHETLPKVKKGEMQTIMPWAMYSGMKEEDLKAIFAYLQSIDPVDNKIVKYKARG